MKTNVKILAVLAMMLAAVFAGLGGCENASSSVTPMEPSPVTPPPGTSPEAPPEIPPETTTAAPTVGLSKQPGVQYYLTFTSDLTSKTVKVYDAASGGNQLAGTLDGSNFKFTRQFANSKDLWVTVTETGKGESSRVKVAADTTVITPTSFTQITDTNFTTHFNTTGDKLAGIGWINGIFVAGGNQGRAAWSDDGGVTWTAISGTPVGNSSSLINGFANGIDENGDEIIIMIAEGTAAAAWSNDGKVWTPVTVDIPFSGDIRAIVYDGSPGNKKFIMGGSKKIYTSTYGKTWTTNDTVLATAFTGGANIGGLAYGNGKFVVVGGNSGNPMGMASAYSSDGGITWTTNSGFYDGTHDGYPKYGLVYNDTHGFVMVGGKGIVMHSTNGINWTTVAWHGADSPNAIPPKFGGTGQSAEFINRVAYGSGVFLAGGKNGLTLYSFNGTNWNLNPGDNQTSGSASPVTGSDFINGIGYACGRFIVVGQNAISAYTP
ncbi:hypothetical protein AGMMS49942_03060 [Spirochaetia bacterium]|nr:hypothetical protein AGMMS49942_03060 [Spirochaetia bacterium]